MEAEQAVASRSGGGDEGKAPPDVDSPFDLNWLCLYLVLAATPLVELAGFISGEPPSLPLSLSAALDVLALMLVGGGLMLKPASPLGRLGLAWFSASGVLSACAGCLDAHCSGFPSGFAMSLFLVLALAALLFCLTKLSPALRCLPSLSAGAAAVLCGSSCVHGMLAMTVKYLPSVYDPVLYRIGSTLGLPSNRPFVEIAGSSGAASVLFLLLYNSLVIAVILAAVSEFIHARDRLQASLILRFLVVAVIGYALYYLMPALDPAAYFGALFPDHLPDALSVADHAVRAPLPASAYTPRNTMPSLHAAWAILAFMALRHSPSWHKMAGGLFAAAILVATLGFGVHYSLDWIVALPLVVLARGIAALPVPLQMPGRRNAIGGGALLLCAWVLVIRGAPASLSHPKLIQCLALASVALPVWLELRLAAAEDAPLVRAMRRSSQAAPAASA